MTKQFVRFGASPRAAQALVLSAKVKALLDDRVHVSVDDVKEYYCRRCGTVCCEL